MVVKKTGATIILVLFCCMIYAKEGYNIVLRPDKKAQTTNNKEAVAYLISSFWSGNKTIDSSFADKKGNITLSGNKNLTPGEYIIKWNGTNIEFFVSDKGYTNLKLQYTGEDLVQKKGTIENQHFIRFQNLISHGWKSLPNAAALQAKIDSTAILINKA